MQARRVVGDSYTRTEYTAGGVRLVLYCPASRSVLLPMLDSAAEIFFAAKGRYIGPGRYDVVFVTDITDEHGERMVGFAVAPDEEEWAINRSGLPPELQKLLTGPFVMVSLAGLDWLSGKYGKEACK